MSKPTAFIMRGLPGSGKSTLARQLAVSGAEDPKEVICSTDDFFMVEDLKATIPTRIYRFDATKLGEYHRLNLEKFTRLCCEGLRVVICDNTNMKREHVRAYKDVAEQNGYDVVEITVGNCRDAHMQQLCAERNVHGLDLAKIQKMATGFEP